jgi:hypothetical protein
MFAIPSNTSRVLIDRNLKGGILIPSVWQCDGFPICIVEIRRFCTFGVSHKKFQEGLKLYLARVFCPQIGKTKHSSKKPKSDFLGNREEDIGIIYLV